MSEDDPARRHAEALAEIARLGHTDPTEPARAVVANPGTAGPDAGPAPSPNLPPIADHSERATALAAALAAQNRRLPAVDTNGRPINRENR